MWQVVKTLYKKALVVGIMLATSLVFTPTSGSAAVSGDELWLSPVPVMKHQGGHAEKPQGNRGTRQSGGGQGHGSHGGHGGGDHESEHRPKMMRTYWLNTCDISPDAKAFLIQPEGNTIPVPIKKEGHEVSVTVKTPFGEGPYHGANNVYLVDQYVLNKTLHVRTTKWLTIHHNCGWGHDHKFNQTRLQSQSSSEAPFEIVVDDLWDDKFHSSVMSGDTIKLAVLSYGKPVSGAVVTVISEKGWSKQLKTDKQGRASFQLVRDYYPSSWAGFVRDKRGKLKITAAYGFDEKGELDNQAFDKVTMSSTFSWRYYPARQEYASHAYGLLTVLIFTVFGGLGVFIYRDRRKKPYKEVHFNE